MTKNTEDDRDARYEAMQIRKRQYHVRSREAVAARALANGHADPTRGDYLETQRLMDAEYMAASSF